MANDFWQTPPHILERVTKVLGEDYFDPCPINPTFDGLSVEWGSNCFINPPYSKQGFEPWPFVGYAEFFRLMADYHMDNQPEFIWLVNYGNCENRRIIKEYAGAICDMHRRIQFIHQDPENDSKQNMYNQMIYYWGYDVSKFKAAFSDLGEVFVK